MTNELLDRAAGYATCKILETAGTGLVGLGVWTLGTAGVGTVPLTLGSLSLLGAGFACNQEDVDGEDSTNRSGCQLTANGGFPIKNQPTFGVGGAGFTGEVWTELTEVEFRDSSQGPQYQEARVRALNINGTISGTTPEWQLVELGTTFGMRPAEGDSCTIPAGDPAPVAPEDFAPEEYTDPINNCTYNIQLLGFVSQGPGLTGDPVWLIEGDTSLRSSGGVVGGCNFEPTVYYGGGGGGGGFGPGGGGGVPPFPYDPGNGDDGIPNWLSTLTGALAGAAGAIAVNLITDAITALLNRTYLGGIYRMVSVCEKNAAGEPISESVDVTIPTLTAPDAQLARLDAIVELLQAAKNFKQPVCPPDRPDLLGDWVTVRFESVENSPQGTRPLRKLFRYRSQSALDLGQIASYWENFTWNAGPVCVQHKSASWGTPQCWAASADEGKRVIRFAGLEAGIDPDAVGEWVLSGSSDPRFGMAGTMRVAKVEGLDWITSRQGPSGLPLLTVDP